MKKILYLGNKLEKHGLSPTSIDTLTPLLEIEGYSLDAVSSLKNKPLRLAHMLGSIILKRNIDIVLIDTYSTSNFWYALLSAKLCRILSIPYIFILHGGNLKERFEKSSKSTLKTFKIAKANVVPSYFLRDKLEKFQFENIVSIPNSIELSRYDFKKRKVLKPKLLWVRSFHKVYNPEIVIEIQEKLVQKYPNASICMVGPEKDGSLKKTKALALEKNLNIQFRGKLSKKEWIQLSSEYDIFINTSNIDNTPVSLIEAMALGMPIVSTYVGGVPYLVTHEENGLLVAPRDAEAMADSIIRLLEDPELSEKLSINGRKKAEEFNWDEVKQLWLELLG